MTAIDTAARSAVIPEVKPLAAITPPKVADVTLPSGLRVLAARRPGVPRFECRLVIPTARNRTPAHGARIRVLAKTLLAGTAARSSLDIAEMLQRLGGGLEAVADSEDLVLIGSALSSNLGPFLDLLAEVLVEAAHPEDEVTLQRERLAQDITLARSQPETVAREALVKRLYGDHPYGAGLPEPEEVEAVSAAQVRALQRQRLVPAGAVLVLVGDFQPARAVDRVGAALERWQGGSAKVGLPAPPAPTPAPILLVDRPGSVQTNIRMAGPAIGRAHPDYPALALANLVFGGYFTSRLVDNIRERRGYTYSPGSGVQQQRSAAHFLVSADVGTDVTTPALVEILYELGRMIALPAEPAELEAAKRYLSGSLSMSLQTQAGLASYLSTLAVSGLEVDFIRAYPKRVNALTGEEVLDAARRFFVPRHLLTVLVGDVGAIRAGVEGLGEVEVAGAGA